MSLTLDHTPGEWDGTFVLTLRFLVEDLLSDGQFTAAVTWQDDEGVTEQVATGQITGFDGDGDLMLHQIPMPSVIPTLNITKIEVP